MVSAVELTSEFDFYVFVNLQQKHLELKSRVEKHKDV